jgi:taurine--2-oxoglutarate transaminase
MRTHHEQLAARHPSVGAARNIGLFGVIELVRDRSTMEPMAPFNGSSDEMVALGKRFRADGLYTLVRWNYFFTNPPLVITEEEMAEGFAIIDRALEETDAAMPCGAGSVGPTPVSRSAGSGSGSRPRVPGRA